MKSKTRDTIRGRGWIECVFEVFFCLYIVAVVVFCWSKPVLLFLLLAGVLCMQLWYWRQKADVVMMVAAAALGTPSELLCVQKGVWTYDAPGLVLGVPVWIPLMWAYLLCLFRRIAISIHAATLKIWPPSEVLARRLLFGTTGGIMLLYYLVSVALINRAIAVVYTVFMILALVFCRSDIYILIFIIGAVLGTLGEYICMKLGFWHYHYPFFQSIGLPLSLPLAWGLSSVIVARFASIFAAEKHGGWSLLPTAVSSNGQSSSMTKESQSSIAPENPKCRT